MARFFVCGLLCLSVVLFAGCSCEEMPTEPATSGASPASAIDRAALATLTAAVRLRTGLVGLMHHTGQGSPYESHE